MVKNDWKHLKLKEIASIKTGPFGSLLHHSDYKDSGTPIITVEHLSEQGITYQNLPFVSDEDKERLSSYLLQEGDIVFSRVGSVDRSSIISKHENNWLFSGRLLRVRPNKSNVYYPFLNYFFHQEYFKHRIRSLAVGGTMPSLNTQILQNVYVSLPPLKEQQKIAEILSTWDEAIAVTNSLIKAKQKLKRGLMQKLFNLPTYKKLEFSQFSSLRKDKFNPKKEAKTFTCIELEHIEQKTGKLIGYTNSEQQSSTKNIFQIGDVLFGKLRPYLKKYAYPNFNGVCSTEIWVLQANSLLCHSKYLFYLIQTESFLSVANKTSGSKMPRSDWSLVSEYPFRLPSLEEQKKIVNLFQNLDKEINLLQKKCDHLQKQKRGLMQKLLTGEWRVKDD